MQEINKILDARIIERHKLQKKRDYLGVSSIGDDCLRKVQLQYEGKEAEFSASCLNFENFRYRTLFRRSCGRVA